jgi:hypothetical protein
MKPRRLWTMSMGCGVTLWLGISEDKQEGYMGGVRETMRLKQLLMVPKRSSRLGFGCGILSLP